MNIKPVYLIYILIYILTYSCDDNPNMNICDNVNCSNKGVCTFDNKGDIYCLCESDKYDSIKDSCIYRCEKGFFVNDTNDGCIENNLSCDLSCGNNEECKFENDTQKCVCINGFHLKDNSCVADNSCNLECSDNEECKFENDIQKCVCIKGYHLESNGCIKSSDSNRELYKDILDSDLRGVDLLRELHKIVTKTHQPLSYDGRAKPLMFGTIDNEDGYVKGVYTGEYYRVPEGEMSNEKYFNCEHTWPKSKGARSMPAKSDLHHLYPTFSKVNSARSSLPFGEVNTEDGCKAVDYKRSGCKSFTGGEEDNLYVSRKNSQVFEPADQHKGNVARAMFYFAVRYGNRGRFIDSQQEFFLKWHKTDPVDEKDIERNDKIFSYQKNRNPFIDCPELLDRIDKDTKIPERW